MARVEGPVTQCLFTSSLLGAELRKYWRLSWDYHGTVMGLSWALQKMDNAYVVAATTAAAAAATTVSTATQTISALGIFFARSGVIDVALLSSVLSPKKAEI